MLSQNHVVRTPFICIISFGFQRVPLAVHCTWQAFNLRVAASRMGFVVFQAVEILVSFAAGLALVGFMFLHPKCARERLQRLWVNNAECAVCVCV